MQQFLPRLREARVFVHFHSFSWVATLTSSITSGTHPPNTNIRWPITVVLCKLLGRGGIPCTTGLLQVPESRGQKELNKTTPTNPKTPVFVDIVQAVHNTRVMLDRSSICVIQKCPMMNSNKCPMELSGWGRTFGVSRTGKKGQNIFRKGLFRGQNRATRTRCEAIFQCRGTL